MIYQNRTLIIIGALTAGLAFLSPGPAVFAATHFFHSDQLPEDKTLQDLGLGERPFGPPSNAVRLVELASLPGAGQTQQIVSRGDSLFIVLKEGVIWEYDLKGNVAAEPFLDVADRRPLFNDYSGWAASRGLRGFAFHPDYDENGLVYTMHKEDPDGTDPDYGTDYFDSEFVLAEWNFNELTDGHPGFRQLFRVRFEHSWHTAQQLGFNPEARPGDADYGLLYACFGDNGGSTDGGPVLTTAQLREVSDISNVGQDFGTIHAGIIRIDPLDPSALSDPELADLGRKRAENGNFSIPLDNPFIGHSSYREELYAKGFRNPLTLSFTPSGKAVVADVGEQAMEEINVLQAGGNYGWPVRYGTFIVPFCDQIDGSPMGADDSMRWMPAGTTGDPAVTFYVRDKDQTNLRTETLARSGPDADGFAYPVFQFSHEGNNTTDALNGLAAIVGGDYYDGFWAEELRGLYLFANLSTDQLFYGSLSALETEEMNAPVRQLPLVDADGEEIALADIVGNMRANPRFGRDRYGNLYLASKTDRKLYRFQGTPRLRLTASGLSAASSGDEQYFELTLERPPADDSIQFTLEVSENLQSGFAAVDSSDFEILSVEPTPRGTDTIHIRYLVPVDGQPRFFRFSYQNR